MVRLGGHAVSLDEIHHSLIKVVIDESKRNTLFRSELIKAIEKLPNPPAQPGVSDGENPKADKPVKRMGTRRTPAVLDPVEVVREGKSVLESRLKDLEVSQLLDIVAAYGIDRERVMKWKKADRIIEKIIEISHYRAYKGDVFNLQEPISE
jgi:hypothetical protein